MIWCEICHACSKPVAWKGAHCLWTWIWPLYLHVNQKSDDDDDDYIVASIVSRPGNVTFNTTQLTNHLIDRSMGWLIGVGKFKSRNR